MGAVNRIVLLSFVAGLLLHISAAQTRYPDPLNSHQYYVCLDWGCSLNTCPNTFVFNRNTQKCQANTRPVPSNTIPYIGPEPSCTDFGYYCNDATHFTYCADYNLTIRNNVACPTCTTCDATPPPPTSRNPCL